jgi:hypothetical protein
MVSMSALGAEILMITTRVDDVPGSTVSQPKCVQHLQPEFSPISFHLSTHHDYCVSNIGALDIVLLEHCNGIGDRAVCTEQGVEALVLVEGRRHLRGQKDRRAQTKRNLHLIVVFGRSRDSLNV